MCVVSVIVKHPTLPPCAVDGRCINPLYYYYKRNMGYNLSYLLQKTEITCVGMIYFWQVRTVLHWQPMEQQLTVVMCPPPAHHPQHRHGRLRLRRDPPANAPLKRTTVYVDFSLRVILIILLLGYIISVFPCHRLLGLLL